jgi:hypothetical protein
MSMHEQARMSGAARRDLLGGGLITLIGLYAVLVAHTYDMGNLTEMGPGFLPVAIGALMILVGVLIAAGLSRGREPGSTEDVAVRAPDWRGGLAIVSSVVAFVLVGQVAGLVLATFLCVFIAALGDRTMSLRGAALLAAIVTMLGSVLFSVILKVPFPLFHG